MQAYNNLIPFSSLQNSWIIFDKTFNETDMQCLLILTESTFKNFLIIPGLPQFILVVFMIYGKNVSWSKNLNWQCHKVSRKFLNNSLL